MNTATVLFRGQSVEVNYKDHGHEPDVNAHDIDFDFVDEELNALELTSEENEEIYTQLYKVIDDRLSDYS